MAEGSVTKCEEYLFKVLVVGEPLVGKTSIIQRYVNRHFIQDCKRTIGVDFALKVINWDYKTVVRLQLWDIAGKRSPHTETIYSLPERPTSNVTRLAYCSRNCTV